MKTRAIRRKLLRWYDKNRRDLPWRHTRDPYAIWVAEIMLQQTQVATVIPYYERFLKAFPTVESLARAPLQRLLAHWSGLGYYRRVENMKTSAEKLVRDYGGRVPDDYDTLLSLAGIGAYTAGALMSIAFGKPCPAIDGNAGRVISRIFNLNGNAELRDIASRLVPASRPGYFNQALMELGATVCVFRNPRCAACPVTVDCGARKPDISGRPAAAKKKPGFKSVIWPLAIVRSRGKILLRRRNSDGVLSGMWELPGGEIGEKENIRASLRKHVRQIGGRLTRECPIGELRHKMTNRKIRAPIFLFEARSSPGYRRAASRWRWVAPAALCRFPVSSMTMKALKILAAHEKNLS